MEQTTTASIAGFLRARLDEDEAMAREQVARVAGSPRRNGKTWAMRAAREVEAKRRIVDEARDYSPELEHGDNGEWAFDAVLRHLAAVYADHPDYDPGWA